MSSADATRMGLWSTLVRELREAWRIYLLVPVVLTLIDLDGWGHSPVWLTFVINFCATLGIGGSTQAAFVISERRGWTLPRNLHYPLLVIVGVGVGTELTLLGLRTWTRFDAWDVRVGVWIIGGTVAVVVAATTLTYDHLRARARRVELREEQAQRQALQAKIDALQSRMNPHFLFNSLNTVAALIEEDPEAAVEAVERLAELLRYTLERSTEREVPMRDELRCVSEYLEIERARFGARLRVKLDLDEDALAGVLVPPLTIQPLVENAVKHGVAPSRTPVTITIAARHSEGQVCVEVHDDGPGSPSAEGTGTAHATLRERLRLLYGDEGAAFSAGPDADGGYRATLRLPSPVGGPA